MQVIIFTFGTVFDFISDTCDILVHCNEMTLQCLCAVFYIPLVRTTANWIWIIFICHWTNIESYSTRKSSFFVFYYSVVDMIVTNMQASELWNKWKKF